MIRRLPVLFAACVVAGAFAQVHFTSPSGFGNVNYPGTGYPPANASSYGNVNFPGTGRPPGGFLPPAISPALVARAGSTARAYPVYTGVARGAAHPAHSRAVVVTVPVVVGGYGYGYGYGYPYDPSAGGYYQDPGTAQQAAQPPVVIINESYQPETANPVVRDYPGDMPQATVRRYDAPVHPMPDPNDLNAETQAARRARSAADDKPTIYLIAFKDHTILPALAYWVEGDTLMYISQQGTPNRASLSLIDRDFSKQLNRERQVDFNLP
jgi:hypothetical protein